MQKVAEAVSEIADAIHRIDQAMNEIAASGLTRRALVLLVRDAAPGHPLNIGQVEAVLDGLAALKGKMLC